MLTRLGHAGHVIVLGFGLVSTVGLARRGIYPSDGSITSTAVENRIYLAQQASPRVTNRPANTDGRVFVLMYHHIRNGKGDMFRTVKQFRSDLDTYYKLGFRPVLASEYLSGNMSLPPGAMPIVLTFDDANPSQLQLKKDGSVDPNCAIGIWMDFAKTHPDFPVHGTFFVLPDVMWGQSKMRAQKIKTLFDLGSELANHSMTHPFFHKLSTARVESELARCNIKLEKMGQKDPISMALPYGSWPRNKKILRGFTWKGHKISFSGVFGVDSIPARSPNDKKRNIYSIPRIIAVNHGDGIAYWLKQVKNGKVQPYVQP